MKRLLAIMVIAAFVAGAGVALVIASPWTDTQTASGNVTAASSSDLLHICEGGISGCAGDDSGDDENIFDGDEQLDPGGAPATKLLLLQNESTGVMDVTSAAVTISESSDPDGECEDAPVVAFTRTDSFADDHDPASDPIGGSQTFPDSVSNEAIIHVGYAGWEYVNVMVSLPATTAAECMGSAWDIDIDFTVQTHE